MTGMMFGLGVAAGAAMFGGWHWGWSGGGWGNSYTTVNVNRATNISANNFDANNYRNGQWQHDPAHRDGVPYRTLPSASATTRPGRAPSSASSSAASSTAPAARPANREQAATNRDQARPTATRPRNARRPRPRGSEGRSAAPSTASTAARQVNRDYDRGRSSWGDRSFDRGGGGSSVAAVSVAAEAGDERRDVPARPAGRSSCSSASPPARSRSRRRRPAKLQGFPTAERRPRR